MKVLKRGISLLLAVAMLAGGLPQVPIEVHAESVQEEHQNEKLEGKKFSILGASISTFEGTSNGEAAETSNSTIKNNAKYYPNTGIPEVTLKDTWWMQVANDLGLELLVNNSWSGSSLLHTRRGTVGAYVERCVQLHDDTGDNAGEEPDIIGIQLGTNDFQYYKDQLGTAEIDYDSLIRKNSDGTYTYGTPVTSLEAAAIVLHKISVRYPNAEVYYLSLSQRIDGYVETLEQFNANLKTVCENFDVIYVDIYNCGINPDNFNTYIGDNRVHPNKFGMDAYAEAFKKAVVENTAYEVSTHKVSFDLTNVLVNYGVDKLVVDGDAFEAYLSASNIKDNLNITVKMGEKDITEEAYIDGEINIASVTDDVTITASSVHIPKDYRWELTEGGLTSEENILTKLNGTVTDGRLSQVIYQLEDAIVLKHDLPWSMEWKSSGSMENASNRGTRIFTSTKVNADYNARYLFKSPTKDIIAMGEKTTSGSHNYGIALSDYGIDASEVHTYRMVNRIEDDGSNMVYLYVDGKEIGPMNNYYVGTTNKNTTSDWLNGKDFVFPYMGTDTHGLTNCSIEYIEVCEDRNHHKQEILLKYDDHMDISGKQVEIIDAGTPTSYQVGYGVEEGTKDTAVITLKDDNTLVATGIGTALIELDGIKYQIEVTAAPISLLLLIGQSNMQGIDGSPHESIVCPDGQVYATYADRYKKTVEDVAKFAPSALTGENSVINVKGDTECLENYPVNMLTEAGNGREGMDSGLAYEWVQQTGEKVWVVNLGYGGSSVTEWLKGGVHYEACMEVFRACQETLRKEIEAGHFTLSHMGYYWCQGCADEKQSAQWYVDKYLAMHENLKETMAFDEDTTFEFGNMVLVHAGHANVTGYRTGTYEDTTTLNQFQSFKDLEMRGSRVAQVWMANNPELEDINVVCTIADDWVTMPDGSNGVKKYFETHYVGGRVDYKTQTAQSESWRIPKTSAAVKDNIHYNQIGYNEVGRESARNTMYLLGLKEMPDAEPEVTFYDWTGYKEVQEIDASLRGNTDTLVVPMVSPCYMSKKVTYETSDNLVYEYYDLLDTTGEGGVLQSVGTESASVNVNEYEEKSVKWQCEESGLVPVENANYTKNVLSKEGGTISNAIFTNTAYKMESGLWLRHDRPWSFEWRMSGKAANMFLAENKSVTLDGNWYVYKNTKSFVGIGVRDGELHQNYGFMINELGFDDAAEHVYRLKNVVEEDSNMIYLYIDDKLVGPLTNHYVGSTFSDKDNYALSGQDFMFNYIGTDTYPLNNISVEYMEVVEHITDVSAEPIEMKYDDRLDLSNYISANIVDAGTPTSYQVGYGVAEGTKDAAVISLENGKLVATGIGSAVVELDGVAHEVNVTAAPISLLLLIGQSNMRGSEGDANQSIVCPDGMVYSTYGDDRGASNTAMTVDNAHLFAPSALSGAYSKVNVQGTAECISGYPLNSLTEGGAGRMGPDSGYAYEWVKQTGEKVWVVNAAHGGTSITTWQPNGANYKEAVRLFGACQDTLRKEIEAGHYTLSHMAYYWCQGCTDYSQSAQWYVNKYLTMHNNLKTDLAFDEDTTFEFAGIVPVRAGHEHYTSYREGVSSYTTAAKYHESFMDLRMTGPRVAQYWMCNNPELTDIWNVCNIGENWVTMPDGTNGVADYFNSHYLNGTVNYTTQVKQPASWYKPISPAAVHDSVHYNQIGYNEIGREAVRNTMVYLGKNPESVEKTTVKFVTWDGFTKADEIIASTAGASGTLVVPMISPVYKSKEVTYELSEGLTYDYYDLLADTAFATGELKSIGSDNDESVEVKNRELTSYRWGYNGSGLKSDTSYGDTENVLKKLAGSVSNGLFSSLRYQMAQPVTLMHDKSWVVEWNVTNLGTNTTGIMLLSGETDAAKGEPYIYMHGKNGFIGIGSYDGTNYYHYGCKVSDYGIDILDGPHTYRLVNRINADGSNMVYLFIDGRQIAPLNQYYRGSTTYVKESNDISGKDFAFPYLGTSNAPLTGLVVDYLVVDEENSGVDVHFHNYSDWEAVTVPSKDALGIERRTCAGCGDTQGREIEGVWQKYEFAKHFQEIPENACSSTNLWHELEIDKEYFASGVNWGTHSSGKVCSITFPVSEGDKIYGTAFGAAGTNGSNSNGIRMTYFDDYDILKTLSPAGAYSEFSKNGYLTVPKGAKYINVPMWTDSDKWEVYNYSLEHSYKDLVCQGCGKKDEVIMEYAGKTISILGDSISTYDGVSNNKNYNSTLVGGEIYYTPGRWDVYQHDTWWQQTADALGMEVLVNNSWSGSSVLHTRRGTVGAYVDRCVQLHNDHTGEEPDVIVVYMGGNDFNYYQDTLGIGDIDYDALITENADGTYTYAEPVTTCEAYAIMLHKIKIRYPEAEVYCMSSTPRRSPDKEDNYPDLGQPTAFNEERKKIVNHFGCTVVDIENCGISKEAEIFDQYIGDGRTHPNAEGMDLISQALCKAILKQEVTLYDVTGNYDSVTTDNNANAVISGNSYVANLSITDEYDNIAVTVTMNGQDITKDAYLNGKISIENVTGDIVISAMAERSPLRFTWEFVDGELTSTGISENPLSKLAGSVVEGVINGGRYQLETNAVLKHDYPWSVEWKCSEDWRGAIMSSDPLQLAPGRSYISRTKGGQLCIGSWDGKQYNNYGIDLSKLDDQVHTYRLENRIADDGSNMVWLYVDGTEMGPMNNYYIGSNSQKVTSDWLSGKDFRFSYIGSDSTTLDNCAMQYLKVDECESNYKGKVISILGDSISTFAGYIPEADGFNLEHLSRYPDASRIPDVLDVNETWWMQIINELDAKLGINDSWRGSTVCGNASVTSGAAGSDAAMSNLTRIQNLGSNGTPNVILFYGGTNDLAHISKVGTFDEATAPSEVDLITKAWDNLADGYVHTLLRLKHYYPEAEIIAMLPTYTASYYSDTKLAQGNEVLAQICEYYDVKYVDLRDSGVTKEYLPDGIHPGAEGMDMITNEVIDLMLAKCDVVAGENVVHSVQHELTNVKASLGHYKGISEGKTFTETLEADGEINVMVTMDGENITDDCYADGKITIENVTGALKIVAKAKFSLGDRLQQLPENICADTNLWPLLRHDNDYYSVDGWAVHSSGTVKSVTIPVAAGERIYASSFEAAGTNGGTVAGIRVTFFSENGMLVSMTADKVYEEFKEYGYIAVPENAVAVNIPMWSDDNSNKLYIVNKEHSFTNYVSDNNASAEADGTKTAKCDYCDKTDTVTDEGSSVPWKALKGKVISILSASTSTFAGYIPVEDGFNLEHRARYPQDNLLTDVKDTWWMQLINQLEAKLGINDSWAGSQVLNTMDGNSGDLGEDAAMASLTRIQNIGANGTPDIILFFGGGNDMGRGVPLGNFDPALAPTEVDLTSKKWNNFADAYVAAIMRLQHFYPNSEIVVMTSYAMPSYVTASKLDKYGAVIKAICEHYGVTRVDLRDCGVTFDMLPDGIHPNAEGMDYITADVMQTLLKECELEIGEHVVYPVTHNLTNVKASLGHFKGISAGEAFKEELTATNEMTVTVTMDGEDITESCYENGKISIDKATGEIVITAKAKYDFDGHLQQLPSDICSGTNIWTLLEPENVYYLGSKWGLYDNSPDVHSVTFPVTAGDRIWATSFGITEGGTGTRITWFTEEGVLESLTRDKVYAEFVKHGYITVPKGAVALNVPMKSGSEKWGIYNLSLEHQWGDWEELVEPTCGAEGKDQRVCDECGQKQYRDTRITGDSNKILVSTPLAKDYFSGKNILLIGDSITAGVGTTKTYGEYLAESLGATVTNKGVSGSGYCSGGAMATNKTLTEANVRDADIISIMLGVNDWAWAVKDGSWNGNPEYYDKSKTYYQLGEFDSTDTSTFYGALHSWCQNIIKMEQISGFEDKQFVVITPLITSWNNSVGQRNWNQDKLNIHGHTFREYCTAIMEVCSYYGIPVFDANMFSGIYYRSEDNNNVSEAGGDGVHVNATGHALLAESFEEFLLEGYGYEARTVTNGGHTYKNGVCEECRLPYVCAHSYIIFKVTEPTCTEQGYTTYICTICEESYNDTFVKATGHTIVVDKAVEPTCEEAGLTEGSHCAVCDTILKAQEVIPALGHKAVVDNAIDPDCENSGLTEGSHCSVCDKILKAQELLLALGHTEVIDKSVEQTCEATGLSEGSHCSVCDKILKVQEVIPALGHKEVTDKDVVPDCENTGLTEGSHCSVCGKVLKVQEVVPALGHKEATDKAVEPDCENTGLTEGSHCSICDKILKNQEVIPALGHKAVTDKAVDPGCETTGLSEGSHCSVCDKILKAQEVIPALGHKAVVDNAIDSDCENSGLTEGSHCTVCDKILKAQEEVPALGHKAIVDKAVEPDCENTGLTEGSHCSVCDKILKAQEVIPALGHKEVIDKAVEADCETTGLTEGSHCSVCNKILKAQEIVAALGHKPVVDKLVEPDCENTGLTEGSHCAVCDKVLKVQEVVPALGHKEATDIAVEPDCENAGVTEGSHCSVCDKILKAQKVVPALGHKAIVDKAIDPGCENTGLTEGSHCSVCDKVLKAQEVIPKLGHKAVVDKAVEPDCENTGLSEGSHCSVCEKVLKVQELIPALGHIEVTDKAVNPGCETTGLSEGSHCSACEKVLKVQEVVPALGHKEVTDKVIDPTCEIAGLTEGSHCERCKKVLVAQEEIPATGHTVVVDKAVAPTCEETGLTEGSHCSVCNKELVKQEVIEALGHKEVVDVKVEATCETTGLTEGKHCDRCKKVLVAQEEIPATGHTVAVDKAVEPSCEATGLTEGSHCSVCDKLLKEQETIEALGHKEVVDKKVDPTCETTGLTEGSHCERCGKVLVEQKEIPATGHTVVVDKAVAPTCEETGLTEGSHCSVCDKLLKEQETIEALGHKEVVDKKVDPTCETTGLTEGTHCERCEKVLVDQEEIPATGHTVVVDKAVAPTCEETGLTEGSHCSVCDKLLKEQETIEALGHKEVVDAKVDPTCEESGLTEGIHCERCKKVLVDQEEIPATGHTDVEDKAVAPTCEKTGLTEGSHCLVCKKVLKEQEVIAALGHKEVVDPKADPTCETTGLTEGIHCERCEKVLIEQEETPATGHTDVVDKAVAPTCEETGLTEGSHCLVCKKVLIEPEVIAALGHKEVVDSKADPTCETTGLTEGIHCERCEKVLIEQEEIPATGHTDVVDKAVEPTCEETGLTEGSHCSVCKKVLKEQEVIAALGHKEVVDSKVEPTCETTGLTEGIHCERCEKVLVVQKEIPATGHTDVMDKAVAPTCEEPGLTEGSHCSVCKKVLKEQEVIGALGHKEVVDQKVNPTCEVTGLTEGKHCERCEKVLVAQKEIPSTGHAKVFDEAVAPTCNSTGLTSGSHCSVCSKVLTAQGTIPALSHIWNEGVITVEPTCTSQGVKTFTCELCGGEQNEILETTVHEYDGEWFYDEFIHWQECICGKQSQGVNHTFEWKVDVDATEFETGLKHEECTVCCFVQNENTVIDKLPHIHNMQFMEGVDATCDESGSKEFYVCLGCNKIYQDANGNIEIEVEDTVIAPIGHEWDEGTITIEPTCTTVGEKIFTCATCDDVITEEVAMLPHIYSTEWTSNENAHWHECECGARMDEAEHHFEWVIDKDATVETVGEKHEECIVCQKTRNKGTVIDKLPKPVLLGDVNVDGVVDTSDAQAIFNHFMGVKLLEGEYVLEAADVNEDGVIDTSDAQKTFNIFMGVN